MATDGVKIIDGDFAHDLYSTFMDMYDASESVESIKAQCEEQYKDPLDEFDLEIFITVYALALWEIGELSPEILAEAQEIIARGAGVQVWTEECSAKEGQRRQRELDKLLSKISTVNPRIRKRRTYKTVAKFVFDENEVLTFQLPDNNYCAAILMEVYQYRGRCDYQFLISTYKSTQKPTLADIINANLISRRIPSSNGQYILVFSLMTTGPKALKAYASQFERLGKIPIRSEVKCGGTYYNSSNFSDFIRPWLNFEQHANNSIATHTTRLKDLLETQSGA